MSTDREVTRIVRSWLEEGVTALPDRVLDAVLDQVPATRQRRVRWPARRFAQMNSFAKIAMAAAAVVALAVIGLNVLPKSSVGGVGGPVATPTPSSPSASPSPTAMPLPTSGDVGLSAGTYYVPDAPGSGEINAQRLTFTVPAGWTTADFVSKNHGQPGEVFFTEWVVTHVFNDVCHWGTPVSAGTTTDALISALSAQKGRTASAPSDATIGGYPAKRIELTVPADLNVSTCTNGNLRYWPGPGPDMSSGLCCNPPGNVDDVYVVDIAGRRLVVVARYYPGSSAADRAELQSVVDSIQIDPLPPLPTPSASASPQASGVTTVPSPSGK
ncbi:MAG: hypothetical protein ACHQ3P_08775 [Candidatus Limnocylindrales bacterium]